MFILKVKHYYLGQAVTNNLLRKGFNVTAITDIKPELCQGYPSSIQVRSSQAGVFMPIPRRLKMSSLLLFQFFLLQVLGSAKAVAEQSDVIVSGKYNFSSMSVQMCLFSNPLFDRFSL
jgi:hypothetical protein